jgi:hypothetical protein
MADANIAVSDLNNYLPFDQCIDLERDELIERYFKLGLNYIEIYVFFFSPCMALKSVYAISKEYYDNDS